ncbi:MAG: ABC transporter permease, partial [Pseudomonadales bacterium]
MPFLLRLAWRDLGTSGQMLWVFCTCLALGVTLVAATGGLYRQVSEGLLVNSRAVTGGDLEVFAREPLPAQVLDWMASTGEVSRLTELDTMLATDAGALQIVELQSVDERYPLYGTLVLTPPQPLASATRRIGGTWGVAVDPVLAERLDLAVGDRVEVGELSLEVRALIEHQPDRSLTADWRGAPVLVASGALEASGLLLPGSRVNYEYRVKTAIDPDVWRDRFFAEFPDGGWEVRTFAEQGDRVAQRLAQVASALLIISFSTLFIGGLGVANSVQAYLRGKLSTIATLRALGLRDRRLALAYLLQIGLLAGAACVVGAAVGFGISIASAGLAEDRVGIGSAVAAAAASALLPAALAAGFGLVTAFAFSLPAIGRALSIDPAVLFRGINGAPARTPAGWRIATAIAGVAVVAVVLVALPDPLFAAAFIGVVATLLLLLDLIVKLVQRLARRLDRHPLLAGRFALRLAVTNLQRRESPLRTALLSLGSALTLLVACATLVAALLQVIDQTIPEESPGLVLYDIAPHQLDGVTAALATAQARRVDIAPLVQGRLTAVNGELLSASSDRERQREARNEHKLTYRANDIDDVIMIRGQWWPAGSHAVPQVAMEDREADQLGLRVGDTLTFSIEDRELTAALSGIYRQRGLQTRFWFEGIFSDGALEGFINRYVGAAYLDDPAA